MAGCELHINMCIHNMCTLFNNELNYTRVCNSRENVGSIFLSHEYGRFQVKLFELNMENYVRNIQTMCVYHPIISHQNVSKNKKNI